MASPTLASGQCLNPSGPFFVHAKDCLRICEDERKDLCGCVNTSVNYFHFSEMVVKEWYELAAGGGGRGGRTRGQKRRN